MPQNANVFHLWDGELRTEINIVYESKDEKVVTADYEHVCYSTESRPKNAPTYEENRYWKTDINTLL